MVAVQAEVLASREVAALADHPSLWQVLAAILGGPAHRRGGDVCRLAFPAAPELATAAHQDAHYMKVEGPVWIAWIPLDECPIERGPLAVIAESHRAGLRAHGGDTLESLRAQVNDAERWTSGAMRAGDVLVLSALTVHCALPNLSPQVRMSVDFRYQL